MSTPATAAAAPPQGFNRAAVVLLGVLAADQAGDALIASFALARASHALHFSASTQSLAAGISALPLAATAIPGGMLADRYGRRLILGLAVLVAAAGQLITASAGLFGGQSSLAIPQFLLGRMIAGAAIGVIFGCAYGMLRNVATNDSLGPAMGLFNIVNGIVGIAIMVICGFLLSISWRLAFCVLPVIITGAAILIRRLLPHIDKLPSSKVDYAGMILLAVGVTGLLYGISRATAGFGNPSFYVPIIIGFASLAGFGIRERNVANPMFPMRLLLHPAFLGAVLMGLFWNMASGVVGLQLLTMWQYVTDLPAKLLGVTNLPLALAAILGGAVGRRDVGPKITERTTAVVGYFLIILGFLAIVLPVSPNSGYWVFVPGMVLACAGWTMASTSQGDLFIAVAPAKFYGPVTASKLTFGQFGYSLGVTASTMMISIFTLNDVSAATRGAVSGDGNWAAITGYLVTGSTKDSALGAVSKAKLASIYTDAYSMTMLIVAGVIALGGIAMYVALKNKKASVPVDEFLGLTK